MASKDVAEFKKEMTEASGGIQKSKLSLIKKRASRHESRASHSTVGGNEMAMVRKTHEAAGSTSGVSRGEGSAHHDHPPRFPVPPSQSHTSSLKQQYQHQHQEDQLSLHSSPPEAPLLGRDREAPPPSDKSSGCIESFQHKAGAHSVASTTGVTSSESHIPHISNSSNSSMSGMIKKDSKSGSKSSSEGSSSVLRCSVQWLCQECSPTQACIPVRGESRCLCGHRYKEHKMTLPAPSSGLPATPENVQFKCSSKSCRCAHFFFVVAEGAWILRCRCKHKHVDHDCATKPFKCKKPRCACNGFDSPWVCNCGHPWASHRQQVVETAQPTGLIAQALALHQLEQQEGGGAGGGVDLEAMVGLLTDGGAMRDLDMNVRRDGSSQKMN